MSIRVTTDISTKLVAGKNEANPPMSELVAHNKPTGHCVSGAVLEAVVVCGEFTLLFLTDDVPFEDMLSIHLLDMQWRLLDSAVIGGMYLSGSFSGLRLSEPNFAHFRFIGDTEWTLEILPKRRFYLPFVSNPPGVKYAFGFYRHFLITGSPHPTSR